MDRWLQRFSAHSSASSTFLALLALAASFIIPAFSTSSSKNESTSGGTMNIPLLVIGIVIVVFAIIVVLVPILTKKLDDEIPSIKEAVEGASQIWGLWWTGDRQYKMLSKSEHTKKYQKILLPDFINDKEEFSRILRRAQLKKKGDKDKAIRQIKRMTAYAINAGVGVKWYTGEQIYALAFYDPETKGGWVIKQDLELEGNRGRRKKTRYRLSEEKEIEMFSRYKREFDAIWQNKTTRVPQKEEYL